MRSFSKSELTTHDNGRAACGRDRGSESRGGLGAPCDLVEAQSKNVGFADSLQRTVARTCEIACASRSRMVNCGHCVQQLLSDMLAC